MYEIYILDDIRYYGNCSYSLLDKSVSLTNDESIPLTYKTKETKSTKLIRVCCICICTEQINDNIFMVKCIHKFNTNVLTCG